MLIRNGTIVTPAGREQGSILVSSSTIAAVYSPGQPIARTPGHVIDATGCYVFPGAIDPHVHMQLPTPAGYSSDDFHTGSRAALYGGTTTLIDFVTPTRNQTLPEALQQRKLEAARCLTDFSFHVSPVVWRSTLPDEIKACIDLGITSFKVYMAYKDSIGIDDDTLLKVMQAVGRQGGVVTAHCELGDSIEDQRNALFASGITGVAGHALSRPSDTESLAVKRAIRLAGKAGCPLYVVHVSAAASLTWIRQARQSGQEVYAEVCPHHLLLDKSSYEKEFELAAPYVLSPPLRSESDRESLWEALADGSIQVVGTDHCPFMLAQKYRGRHDFRLIANGAGGVEHRLELLYTYGVLAGRISMERLIEVVATNPAKIFGLYPKKGCLEPGADADIVVWNPDTNKTISVANHQQHSDHSIYEGMAVKGSPAYVIKNGVVAVADRILVSEPEGRYLPRKPGN